MSKSIDPKSMLMGWLMGRQVAGQRKKPVAWLYNGMRFPEMPEWDTVAYPCAVLQWCSTSTMKFDGGWVTTNDRQYARLIVSDQPLFYAEGDAGTSYLVAANPVRFMEAYTTNEPGSGRFSSDLNSAFWESFTIKNTPSASDDAETGIESYRVQTVCSPSPPIRYDWTPHWTNRDIYNLVTGELYLAPSDPTPVYE